MTPFSTTRFSALYLFFSLILLGLTAQAQTSFTVTSTDDSGPGTLRQAMLDINGSALSGPFTVTFSVSGTVNLASGLTAPTNKNVTIVGTSSTTTAIILNGGGASSNFSILSVPSSATLSVRYLAFTNGHISSNGGAISLTGGRLQLDYCHLYGNAASNFGGALYHGGGSFTITNSTFASNTAISNSGALHKGASNPSLIENCTFSGNVARAGGAIEASVGSLTINNSTFTQNRAIGNPTPTGADGGAIFGGSTNRVTINNCLIVGNSTLGAGPDLLAGFNSITGYNLIGNSNGYTMTGTTTGNITSVSAGQYGLGNLGNYGAATPTHALLPGSVAIDAGSPSGPPTTDQRGISRVGIPDIGAFESQGFSLAISSGNNQSAFPNKAFANPLRVSVSSANGEPVEGGIVSFSAPVSGPSATLSSTTVTISSGTVAVNATANATAGGPYSVTVGATGAIPATVAFSLTNTACPSALISVTSTADSGPGTLREAITNANANVDCGPYLITLPANQTISLTTALPDILFSGTIAGGSTLCPATGVGGSTITRTGSAEFRLLTQPSGSLLIRDLVLQNGDAPTSDDGGGAIKTENASLTVIQCLFRQNTGNQGGAISNNTSTLLIDQTLFDDNSGALSSVLNNSFAGVTQLTRSTLRQNNTNTASLVYIGAGSVEFINCTMASSTFNTFVIRQNGVYGASSLFVRHSTIQAPNTDYAIGVASYPTSQFIQLQNSIFGPVVVNPLLFDGSSGSILTSSSGGNMFAGDFTAGNNASGTFLGLPTDKKNLGAGLGLGSLTALAGECNLTIPLLPGSPAINAGVSTAFTTDERGIGRVGSPDAGSFESRGFTLSLNSGNNQSAPANTAFVNPLRVLVSSANGEPVEGGVVSFSARASGASAILSSTTATISSGLAAVNATANATQGGPYNVTATSAGSSPTVLFSLTNAAACVYSYTANLNDTGAGSLRNVLATIGTISGCTGQFTVTFAQSGTVNLASTLTAPAKDVLVLGPTTSATAVVLRGGGAASDYSILNILGSAQFEARYLSFTNARTTGSGGAINLGGGELQLANCHLFNNTAGNFGGAIYQGSGSFTVINSTFASNTAISNSGAIHKSTNAPSLIENCTFSGNVGRAGGAIEASAGSLTINNSTFTLNQAVGSPAGNGASAEGGAIYGGNGAAVVTINNCLIAGNTSVGIGPDLVSGFSSDLGHNLIGNTAGGATFGGNTTGNLTNIPASDYLLTALANYGGATPTHALLPGSVALNAGLVSGAPTQDQRGITRGSRPDIGAFESRGFTVGVNSGNNQSALFGMSFANPLRVIVVANSSGEPVIGGVVTFQAPATLPSANLSGSNVTITSGFTAQVTATANAGTGPYSVTASTRGGTTSAVFSLTSVCRSIVYVTEAGAGSQNGTSWTNAYPGTALQEAIGAASGCSGGQVWVARGTYRPTTDNNRDANFRMDNNVAIYGGFVGNETALSNRPGVNPLMGQPASSTLSGNIGSGRRSYHVIYNAPGVTNTAILDGFVITRGSATETSLLRDQGGAILNDGSSPTIRNCVFTDNQATYGGAMFNRGDGSATSSPVVVNCVFQGNSATIRGGAVENSGQTGGNNASSFTQVLFQGNTATFGAAVSNAGAGGNCSPAFVNVSFQNQSGLLGAVMYNNASSGVCNPTFTNVSFQGNLGTNAGDLFYNVATTGTSNLTLTNCVLFGNGSNNAFFNTNASVTASYSLFDAAIDPATYTATNSLTTSISPFASTTSTELSSCAPAINAGNNAAPDLSGITTDIVGANRTIGATVDMGAYEFTGTLIGQTGFTTQPAAGSGVCTGATVTAGVSVSGTGPFSYQWYRNGAALTGVTSATTANLTLSNVTSASAGSYVAVVTGGCNSATSTAFSLTVNPPPTAGLVNNGPLTCAQTSVTLTASGGISYTFANASGIIGTPGASTTQTVSSAGTYSVTVANANGCVSSTTTSVGQNTALTSFGVTASASVCAGTGTSAGSVTLTASGCTGGTVNWPGGAGLPGITGNIYSTSVNGIYTATCTIGACSTTASGTATIGASPTATLSTSNAGTLTCAQTSLTLTATSGVSYTFAGPGLSQSGNSATAVVNQSGTYSVTAANALGCSSTTSVVVSENTTTPTVSLGASNSLNCSLPSATLSATATGFGTLTYAFQNSSGLLPGSPSSSSTVVVNAGGSYSVLVTAANGCTAIQTTSVISDTALPTVSITPTSATLTCAHPSLTLTATSSETGLRWSTGASSMTLAVNSAGTYSVTATAPNGCTVASNTVVIVSNTALTGFTVASSASVCGVAGTPTGSVTLTASGCTGGTVAWPGGITGNTYSTSLAGTYTATCTIGACSTTASGTAILASQFYTVTSLADAGAGTLRQALADIGASSCPGPFTVTFGLSGTINLATGLTAPVKDVLILGPSSTTTAITLNGGGAASDFSILTIPLSATLTGRYLAFTNGHTSSNGGAILLDGGIMHLAYCYVYGNSADNFSGAIHQGSGSFTITNSTFASNTAISNSGALHKASSAPGLINNSTFSGNVGRAGGAIEASAGSLTINNSTFTQNRAVGNPSPSGADGGAIYGGNSPAFVTLNNCLIVGNTSFSSGPDLVAGFDSNIGYNLIGTTSGATVGGTTTGNITGVSAEAVLSPTLATNSGPTPTHAILLTGPAYNAGPPASTDADQRGLAMFGGRRDIGAFESQTQPLTATIGSVSGLCAGTGGFSLTAVGGTGSGYQYRLTNAGSFSALPTNPYTVTVSASGTYTITAQDSDGNLSNAVAVTILSEPTSPTLSAVLNCGTNSATLTANCTVGTALWSTSAMSRTIVVPATAMIYSASCVTSNCTSTGSSLTINPTANSFTVTSTADSGPNTLRQAILDMNAMIACEPFLITINAPGPVSLTAALPELLKSVTITSANALTPATATGGSTIERATGSADFRLLLAKTAGKSLTLQNLILQNGVGTPLVGFAYSGGGAVMTRSTVALTMQRCLVRNCTTVSGSDGGGIQAFSGRLTLSDCEFRNNAAIGSGGAVITGSYATINSSPALIERCTFVGNSAINSTFGVGGAVNLSGSSTVVTSTFDSNSASSSGKALYSYNPLTLRHSTFRNQVVSGVSAVLATDNTITLQNNLFAQNTAPHFTGSYVSLGGNVSDKPDATTLNQATDRVGQPVSVSAAAANGGLMQTCELTGGCSNPAIDAGVATTLTSDARGIVYVGAPDAGAYENGTGAASSVTVAYPATQTATVGVSFASAFSVTGGALPYTFTLVSGILPNGLTLSAAGSLSGTPTQAGTFTLIVRGTDANGCIALSNPYTLTVGLDCQPILHVTESGSGLQDGSSWANSFPGTALQTAIDQAASCGGGEVWVARGTYKPTTYTGPDSRTVSFAMRNNIQIYGGFDGLPSETTLGSRPVQNPRLSQFSSTTLSGDIGTVGNNADNSYHVISNPTGMPTETALLDGVVLTGGNADGSFPYHSGGGLYNDNSSPTLQNCLFAHNTAEFGGGIAVINSGTPVLTNCAFLYNTATNGGGMVASSSTSQPILTGCRFEYNSATSSGGGISNSGKPTLTDCLFQYNTAGATGGAIASGGSNLFWLTRCVFRYNTTNGAGGAIRFTGFDGVLTHCVFQSNTASEGGGIYSGASSPTLLNCAFGQNVATTNGGAMMNVSSLPTLINCSFQSNSATTGGAIRSQDGSNPTIANSVFFGNGGSNTLYSTNVNFSTHTLRYSLTEPTALAAPGVVSGPGNLTASVSPFASTTDITLATCSPAINAGDPASITVASPPYSATNLPATDLAGNARIFNGGSGGSGRVDMGAVEFQGEGLPTSYSVLGSGTATCASSPTITLSGSETGVNYQLLRGGSHVGGTVAGTGSAISFGPQSVSGTYTVLATGTTSGCTAVMAQSATVVSSTAVPTVSISASSGTLTCAVTSVTLTATTSETALLWSNGSTTSSITVNAAAPYSVTVTNASGCTAVSNSLTIGQNSTLPTNASLTASHSGTLTCSQKSLTLTASATGAGLTYAFSGPGVVAQSGSSATVNTAGTYTVVITGSNSCTTSTSSTVYSSTTVPTLSVNPTSGTLTCANPSLTLTASGGAGLPDGTSYIWTGGITGATLPVSTSGTYSVTAIGANGCTATTSVVISQSATLPTASLVASGTLTCAVTAVTLTASGGTTYAFSGPRVIASVGNSATVNAQGTYSVTVNNTATGCFNTTTLTVQSNTAVASVNLNLSNGTLTCTNPSLTLTATSSATALRWSTGATTASITVNSAATYSVTATGTNSCTAIASAVISQSTTPPTAGLVSSGTITCGVPSVTLTASGGTANAFSGPGVVSQSGNTAVVNTAGLYSVTVTNTATGCSSTTNVTVYGNLAGAAPIPTLTSSGSVVCPGANLIITATVSGTASAYQWFRNGVLVGTGGPTLSLFNVDAAQGGSYVLVVTGGCGSATTTAFSLTVKPAPVVTLSLLNNGGVLQATGGVLYERMIVIDRINNYEIRQVDSSTNGFFTITRVGAYRLIVTGANSCKTTVESTIDSLPR